MSDASAPPVGGPDRGPGRPGGALAWAGVALLTGCGLLSGLIELLLVPLYLGSALLPVTVVLAIASNAVLPRLARTLVPSARAAALPLLGWLLVVIGVGLAPRPEGDVILPAGGGVEWVSLGMPLLGALVGTVTVVLGGVRVVGPGAINR